MHSISDLTTFARKTKGNVPPQLVGASTTVVGNKMYLFGGRLVSLRRMVSDLYIFDLETFVWEKVDPSPDEDVPGARYFHSADAFNDNLILFGGMGYVAPDSEELCVLNDVRLFDIHSRKWRPASPQTTLPPDTPNLIPRSRYAHLSSVTADRLFIIGGQDMTNVWLDDIHVYDLVKQAWIQRQDYPRHCGTYRSVAVSGKLRVRLPQEEESDQNMGLLGPPGSRFRVDGVPPASPTRVISDEVQHLPYSARPTPDFPNDIMLYSNYNFTDVRRELEVISPQHPNGFSMTDRSDAMTGVSLPPGLRFPTGAILGSHLIIAGTYLAHSYQSFSIWALDLQNMTWTRIDAGTTLTTGSWSRGVLWSLQNKFLIFGNRAGNLVEDYNRRLLSWDHVAYIDLEAFGIYQPPRLVLELRTQEMGLAALEERVLADFEIVCDDGRRIACSRRTLEERWRWFAEQRKKYLTAAKRALETLPVSAQGDVPLPTSRTAANTSPEDSPPDPRLTPRALRLSEPYSITLALLQYFYSLGLITPLQHSPPVLSALLLLSTTYKMPHLEALVKHAMHKALSPMNSVGVYEVATLCDCQSLQIRALKVVMSSSRRPNGPSASNSARRDERDRGDRHASDREQQQQSRPRGYSDANRLRDNTGDAGGYTSSASRGGGGGGGGGVVAAGGTTMKLQAVGERKGSAVSEHGIRKGSIDMGGGRQVDVERVLTPGPENPPPYVVVSTTTSEDGGHRKPVARSSLKTPRPSTAGSLPNRSSGGTDMSSVADVSTVASVSDHEDHDHDTDQDEDEESEIHMDMTASFPAPPSLRTHGLPPPSQHTALRAASLSPSRNHPPSSFSRSGASLPMGAIPQRMPIRRQLSDLSMTTSSSASTSTSQQMRHRDRAGSDATGSTDGPLTPAVSGSGSGFGGGNGGLAPSPTTAEFTNGVRMMTLDRIDETVGLLPPVTTPKHSSMMSAVLNAAASTSATPMPSMTGAINPHYQLPPVESRHESRPSMSFNRNGSASSSSQHLQHDDSSPEPLQVPTEPLRRQVTGTSSTTDSTGSINSPAPTGKLGKAVEKARRNLEKLERKAIERADKEAALEKERAEKRKKWLMQQPSAQEMFDRGRYMSVMGFR